MLNFRLACRHAVSDGIPLRSLYTAIVVGTILNLINQGEALFGVTRKPFGLFAGNSLLARMYR
jgi:hypothetical protein